MYFARTHRAIITRTTLARWGYMEVRDAMRYEPIISSRAVRAIITVITRVLRMRTRRGSNEAGKGR